MSLLKLLERQTAGDDDVPEDQSIKRDTVLYAATNLESWETDEPDHYARDVGSLFPAARSGLLRLAPAQDGAGQEGREHGTYHGPGLRCSAHPVQHHPRLGDGPPRGGRAPSRRPGARSEDLCAAAARPRGWPAD